MDERQINSLKCPNCRKAFKTRRALKIHMIRWSCNIVLHGEKEEEDEERGHRQFDGGDDELIVIYHPVDDMVKVVVDATFAKVKLSFNHWNELWLCKFGIKNSLSQSALDELREWFHLVSLLFFCLLSL